MNSKIGITALNAFINQKWPFIFHRYVGKSKFMGDTSKDIKNFYFDNKKKKKNKKQKKKKKTLRSLSGKLFLHPHCSLWDLTGCISSSSRDESVCVRIGTSTIPTLAVPYQICILRVCFFTLHNNHAPLFSYLSSCSLKK